MIAEAIKAEIVTRLRRAEEEHRVKILFAIESGSRAWGFASPNSDYDVRFVYVHEPMWYQSIDLEERRDVIEYPIVDDIDLNGWDVRKALRLFSNSNPTFVEWIQSPITYSERGAFRRLAVQALPEIYSAEKGSYHYRSMARTNYRGHFKEATVRLKKYFYVLRPLLAAIWIEKTGKAAPIEFQKLLPLIAEQPILLEAVLALLEQKINSPELGLAPAVPVLNAFIEDTLKKEPAFASKHERDAADIRLLNAIFQRILYE